MISASMACLCHLQSPVCPLFGTFPWLVWDMLEPLGGLTVSSLQQLLRAGGVV